MSYDHWKTTEPESGYDPPGEDADEAADRAIAQLEARLKILRETAAGIMVERNKYEATLRKIAAWKGYAPHNTAGRSNALNPYERGANDMLETLQEMAKEALA